MQSTLLSGIYPHAYHKWKHLGLKVHSQEIYIRVTYVSPKLECNRANLSPDKNHEIEMLQLAT